MNKIKIAGVVILYNPDENVSANIKSYEDQIDKLLIFDNSKTKKPYINDLLKSNGKIVYYTMHKNMGVAFAINYAAQIFIGEGYNYLLTMDQDSKATPGMVTKLFDEIKNKKSIGIISPFHNNKIVPIKFSEDKIEEVMVIMTSGNLLNLSIYNIVGPFRDDFFIDYIDIDYCFRLQIKRFKIVRLNDVFLYHNEGDLSERKFFQKKIHPYNHKPFRWYYKIRNFFYLKLDYENIFPEYFRIEKKLIRNDLLKILLYEKHKFKKYRYAIKGFIDFKKGIQGELNS